MKAKKSILIPIALLLCLGVVMLAQQPALGFTRAERPTPLKLKVQECKGPWLPNVPVSVTIVRPGDPARKLPDARDHTDRDAYGEFILVNLEDGDQAEVRITAATGQFYDSVHRYLYVIAPGNQIGGWELTEDPVGPCLDSWYDEEQTIIHCQPWSK